MHQMGRSARPTEPLAPGAPLTHLGVEVRHVARELDEDLDCGKHHTGVRGAQHLVDW